MVPFSGKCNSDAGADKARGQRRESGTPGGYQKYLAEHFGTGQGDGVWAVQYLSEPPENSLLYLGDGSRDRHHYRGYRLALEKTGIKDGAKKTAV